MAQKIPSETSNLDHTKITSAFQFRSDLSDVARLLRKEEVIKRKLKQAVQANTILEKQIKTHQSEIGDERAGITYQLTELLKELTGKLKCFGEEKLTRPQFKSNEVAQKTMKDMMEKYEQIEEQSDVVRKISSDMVGINTVYEAHSKEMEEIVLNIEAANQAFEAAMEESIGKVSREIQLRKSDCQRIQQQTQDYISDIDRFIKGVATLKGEEKEAIAKIEKLKRIAGGKQEKVNEIEQWDQVMIDMGNRQLVFKNLAERQLTLAKQKGKNDRLEMLLKELESQERSLIETKVFKNSKNLPNRPSTARQMKKC